MLLAEVKSNFLTCLVKLYDLTEAENIFFHVISSQLNYSKIEIRQNLNISIDPGLEKIFMNLLERLRLGEPVQYVLGYIDFYGNHIRLNPAVLIPRPETEFMVDMIIKDQKHRQHLHIADLCSGSGCVAIALAKNLNPEKIIAIDDSDDALEVAKCNAKENQVSITFMKDDLLSIKCQYPCFDLMASNPPYVRESEKEWMHVNVLNYEPSHALFVSDLEPLIFYNALSDFGMKHLTREGVLYAEINEHFGSEVRSLFLKKGYSIAEIRHDIHRKDRYLVAYL